MFYLICLLARVGVVIMVYDGNLLLGEVMSFL